MNQRNVSYLDDIEQRPTTGRRTGTSPRTAASAAQDLRNAYGAARRERDESSVGSNGSRKRLTWVGVLIVLIVVAVGGWLGLRRFAIARTASEKALSAEATQT